MSAAEPTPAVSVLTPNLDGGATLAEALSSVRAQAGVDWEHVVVDGGSADNSGQVLDAHRDDPRLRAIVRPGANQSEALNLALEQARAPVVVWLDSDDRLEPGALKRAVAAFRPGIDVVYGAARRFDERTDETVGIGHTRIRHRLEETMLDANLYCAPATWWRTQAVRELGGFRPQLELALHVDLWVRHLVRRGQGGVAKVDALLAAQAMRTTGKAVLGSSRHKQELHSMWRDLFAALDAPAEMLAYCDALTPYPLPPADWQPGPDFDRRRLLAGFCERVVRLYYYDGAYTSARAWLKRANTLGGLSPARLRLAFKLAMKKV